MVNLLVVVLLQFSVLLIFSSTTAISFSLNFKESPTVNEIQRSEELELILKKAVGVYQDSLYNPKMNKTVIITSSSYGYLNFLCNFKCFMDRLKLKVLVVSMDSKIHMKINQHMNTSFSSFFWQSNQTITGDEINIFRSAQFNSITHRKIEAIILVMTLGYDVIFIDSDIALIRDPIPYLIWRNVDYSFSHNKICPQCEQWDFYKSEEEGNTGFFYSRSNENTIKLWKDVLQLVSSNKNMDDQSVFWMHLRATKSPQIVPLLYCGHFDNSSRTDNQLVVCPLDGCLFSAGGLRGVAYDWLKDNLKRKNETVVTLHANYRKGGELKKKDLETHGYWIARKSPDGSHTDGLCKAFVPTI